MFTRMYVLVYDIYVKCVYRYELEARGCKVHAEAPAPTRYMSSDGRLHVLSNDRIDHIVTLEKEVAFIEVKKSQPSETAKYDATQQIIRYCRNYQPTTKTNLYCVFFPRYANKSPVVLPVDFLPPNQVLRSLHNREEALEKLNYKHTNVVGNIKSDGNTCVPKTPTLLKSMHQDLH